MQSRFGVQLWGRFLTLRGVCDFAPACLSVGLTAAAVNSAGPSGAAVTAAPALPVGSSSLAVRTNLGLLLGPLRGRGYTTAPGSCQKPGAVSARSGTSLPGHASERQDRHSSDSGSGSGSASASETNLHSAQVQRQHQQQQRRQKREWLQTRQRRGEVIEGRQVWRQSKKGGEEQQVERRKAKEGQAPVDKLIPRLIRASSYKEVTELMRSRKEHSVRTLTAALHAVGRICGQQPGSEAAARAALSPLFALATPQFGSFDSQGLSNAAWAAGKCKYTLSEEEQQAFGAALRAQALAGGVKPSEASLCFYSFGQLRWVPGEDVVQLLVDAVLSSEHQLTGQQAANVLWGISRNRLDAVATRVPELLEAAVPLLGSFDLKAITSCLFSLAAIHCGDVPACQGLLPAFVEAIEPWLPIATARHLAMLTWALGGLQLGCHVSDGFWSKLEEGLLRQPHLAPQAPSQLLAGAVWMQRQFSDSVLEVVLASAQAQVRKLQSNDIGALLWALGRMGYTMDDGLIRAELLQSLLGELLRQVAGGRTVLTRHVATSLWGLSLVKFPIDEASLDTLTSFLEEQYSAGGTGIVTYDAMLLLTAYEYFQYAPGFMMLKRHITGDQSEEATAFADLEAALESER